MNNHSRNFFENDEDIVIDMTRFTGNSQNSNEQENSQNKDDNAEVIEVDLTRKNTIPQTTPILEESHQKTETNPNVKLSSSSDTNTQYQTDIENFSMEGAEKETTIFREIKNGYLIQKTVIIEKKKIANTTNNDKPNGNTPTSSIIPQANNSQSNITVPNQNLTTKNDATDLKIESLARSFSETIQSPISNEPEDTQEYENQQNDTLSRIEKSLSRKLLFIISGFLIAIIIIFIMYSIIFGQTDARNEFKEIIASVEPIKSEVEKCILAENTMFKQNCNSNQKSVPHNWDLSNRFLTEKRHPSVSNITIEGGTITMTSNYTHSLKGANYILVPELSPNRTVRWTVSSKSSCKENTLC